MDQPATRGHWLPTDAHKPVSLINTDLILKVLVYSKPDIDVDSRADTDLHMVLFILGCVSA